MSETNKKKMVDIPPEVGTVLRQTTVERVYQGPDKPLAVQVVGTGNIEEAILDLNLGAAYITERTLLMADPDFEPEVEDEKGDESSAKPESLTDDGD